MQAGEDVVVSVGQQVGTVVAAGGDVTVDGTVTDAVVAFGGDVTVNGSVGSSIVAFGGDVTLSGSVGSTVVAFGGDVHLLPTAVVGSNMTAQDHSVVLFGGALTRDAGAQVTGTTQIYDNANWGGAISWLTNRTVIRPWWGFSLLGWIVQTAIFLVLALVAAALMPRQLRAVQRKLAEKPAASLGWGALTFFIIVPAVLVVLIISIVGLLLVLPYVVVVPLFYFFVITAVATFIADKVLAGSRQKNNLMLAVTLGVLGTTIISRVPVVGGLVLMVMAIFGAGAAAMALMDWRRARRPATAPVPPGTPGWPAGAPPAVPATAPAGMTAAVTAAPAMETSAAVPPAQGPGQAAPAVVESTAPTAAPAPTVGADEATAATGLLSDGASEAGAAQADVAAAEPEATAAAEAQPGQVAPAGEQPADEQPAGEAPPVVT